MSCASHPWFDDPNNIWRRIQLMNQYSQNLVWTLYHWGPVQWPTSNNIMAETQEHRWRHLKVLIWCDKSTIFIRITWQTSEHFCQLLVQWQ
jgi:hypothetical protein